MVFGLETAGTSLLWCALAVSGAGAYAGGTFGSKLGEDTGTFIYKVIKND